MNERELLTNLYRNIFGTDRGSDIKSMFEDDIAKVKTVNDAINLYKKYEVYLSFGRALGTIKNISNDFKKIIKGAKLKKHEELLLNLFSLPEGYYYAVNKQSAKVVEERKNESLEREITEKEFDKLIVEMFNNGMDKNISFWKKGLGSRQTKEGIRAYYLAAYLALVTGRRLTEVLKTMTLTKYKDTITIRGLLKKGVEDEEGYKLLVLDDATRVVTAWRGLRAIFNTEELTNREVNSKYNNIFNNFFKEHVIAGESFTTARALFAEMAFVKFGSGTEKKDFMESALLHESKIRAVDFYQNRISVS